jgi:hypothetical protein
MSGKPSEGPFEIMEGQDHVEVVASDGRTVAVFWAGALDISAEEALANARLFVASHNLLAELKWFMDDLKRPHSIMAHFDEHVARARAAIKEASGE